MLRLTHLMTKKVIIARMATVSGFKTAYSTVTAEMMHVMPTARGSSALTDGLMGKAFTLHCDCSADVKAGDRLKDEDGNYFTIMPDGVTDRSFGSISYKVIIVQKTKS